jgi:protein-S-isoprenylcysteine O-methyltransferase Ste14
VRLVDHFAATGDRLFRWRSYLPLALVPLFLVSFIGLGYPFGSHAAGLAWEVGCFLIASVGLAIRLVTVGTAPRGTSGRNTRHQKATVLNTTGPYAVVRHPLYLANYLIALGLSLFSRTWYLPLIVSLATLLYYERIAAREEAFLEERFGADFRQWAARVPALLPRFTSYVPPTRPFDWRRALGREFYAVGELTTAFFVADILEDFAARREIELDPLWTTVFVAGALFFLTLWALKKTGRLRT